MPQQDTQVNPTPTIEPSAMYPYCETCKERGPSHSEGDAQVEAFLAKHRSPDHQVDPKWGREL